MIAQAKYCGWKLILTNYRQLKAFWIVQTIGEAVRKFVKFMQDTYQKETTIKEKQSQKRTNNKK